MLDGPEAKEIDKSQIHCGTHQSLSFPEEELAMNKPVPLEDLLAQAYQDWVVARLLFDENQDPDMIDFTIYNLKAAEHRYCYLLKKARQEYNIDCAYHRQPTNSFEAGLFL